MTTRNLGPLPANLCSHLQNTSRGFLSKTSVPYSNSSLAITSILLRSGLISNLTLGSSSGPQPIGFSDLPIPDRKLWIGLKHRNGQPVLRRMNLVSKPSFRVVVDRDELGRLLVGKRARNVPGVGIGEILIIRTLAGAKTGSAAATGAGQTDRYLEGWEAWRAGLGGEVICRVG